MTAKRIRESQGTKQATDYVNKMAIAACQQHKQSKKVIELDG
jgi:hypothetical protein